MAFFIVFYHTAWINHNAVFGYPKAGYLAVDFFFIVSGYMIMRSCRENQRKGTEPGTLRYCFHKLMSFLPYLIVVEIIFGIVNGLAATDPSYAFEKNFDKFMAGMWYQLKNILCLSMLNIYNGDISWYLSALILSTLILYPIIRRSEVVFPRYIAPALGVILIIIILVVTGQINSPNHTTFGFLSKGLILGVAEMSLGIFAYELTGIMQKHRFKNDNVVYTVTEIAAFVILAIFMIIGNPGGRAGREVFEFIMVAVIFIGTTITLSTLSMTYEWSLKSDTLCNNAKWFAVGSLLIYLNHAIIIAILDNWMNDIAYIFRVLLVIALTLALCFVVYVLGNKLGKIMTEELKKSLN